MNLVYFFCTSILLCVLIQKEKIGSLRKKGKASICSHHPGGHFYIWTIVRANINIKLSCRPDSAHPLPFLVQHQADPPHLGGQLQRFDNMTAPPYSLLSYSGGPCGPRGGSTCNHFPSAVMRTSIIPNSNSSMPAVRFFIEFASITPLRLFPPFFLDCLAEIPSLWKASATGTGSPTR